MIFRTYKRKFTYDVLSGIATCLIDGTVFEIVKGLEDIQQLSERNLLNKRMKIVNSQKGKTSPLSSNYSTSPTSEKESAFCTFLLTLTLESLRAWFTWSFWLIIIIVIIHSAEKNTIFHHAPKKSNLIKLALGKSKNLSLKGQFLKSNYSNLLHNHFTFSSATRYQKYFIAQQIFYCTTNLLRNHFTFSSATRYQKYFKCCHFSFISLLLIGKV